MLEQEALEFIVGKLREVTADVDVAEISTGTVLKALGVRSIIIVNVIAEIQDRFGLENELFDRLLGSGVPLDEQSVGDLVGYVVAAAEALAR